MSRKRKRKRKRKNIPRHMLPENRNHWQEFNLEELDESSQGTTVDWLEIGAECTKRRNGKPLWYYLEEQDDEHE